jgi:ribonuclease-3
LSKHEEKLGCRNLNSICACAFEAILGAYYLDGKFNEIIQYIEKTFNPYIEEVPNILKDLMQKQSYRNILKDKRKPHLFTR